MECGVNSNIVEGGTNLDELKKTRKKQLRSTYEKGRSHYERGQPRGREREEEEERGGKEEIVYMDNGQTACTISAASERLTRHYALIIFFYQETNAGSSVTSQFG